MKKTLLAALAACVLAGAGCKEEGPAEKAGKELDKAAEKTKEGLKDAGDKLKEATK